MLFMVIASMLAHCIPSVELLSIAFLTKVLFSSLREAYKKKKLFLFLFSTCLFYRGLLL